MNIWAIIPVKSLYSSKSRLAAILSPEQRAELTSAILGHTLDILAEMLTITRVLVVSRDPSALKIARQHGASTYVETEKQDLNLALTRAAHIAAAQRADGILVLPADLPFITRADVDQMLETIGLGHTNGRNGYFAAQRTMTICTDLDQDGTNALLLCPPTGFSFKYGPGSYEHHLAEAERVGMTVHLVETSGLEFDLDTISDWQIYQAQQEKTDILA